MDMSYCLGMAKEASMPAPVEDDDTLLAARATSDIVRDAHCMADMVAAFFRAQGLHFRRKRSGSSYGTAEGGPKKVVLATGPRRTADSRLARINSRYHNLRKRQKRPHQVDIQGRGVRDGSRSNQ